MEKLVLIDGNSLINRAFYAMPLLTTKDGVYTNAVYGFMNMFFKILDEDRPKFVAVAFDLKAPTFRHEMYAEYKGTRKPMPEELRPQIPLLKEILKTMNVAVVEKEGFEADDVIGTLSKNTDLYTLIFTGDRDAFQLVDKTTEVRFTKKGISETEAYTAANFSDKTGLTPKQIIDLKSLMGDSSDNIPGVNGVGEKTAVSLLKEYGSLDGVYDNLDKIKGKLYERLKEDREKAYLSYTLATIKTDCDLQVTERDMSLKTPFSETLRQKFRELEFKSLYLKEELFGGEEKRQAAIKEPIKTKDMTSLTVPEEILAAEKIAVYVAKSGINLSDGKNEYRYKTAAESLLDYGFSPSAVVAALKPIFTGDTPLIVFDKKELMHFLADVGAISLTAPAEDVSLIKYLADYSGGGETAEELAERYRENKDAPAFSLYGIYRKLYPLLKEEDMEDLYKNVELPLVDVLFSMERAGFKVDIDALTLTGEKYSELLKEYDEKIKALAGEPNLNVNSPKQLGEVLFDKLKIGKGKKTKTGYSTSAEILESYEDAHPVIPLILKYRKIQKLFSTYVEGFKPLIDRKTGLIHTSFNQTVTSTGRLSSKEPNLQNIPVRDDEGKELRKFFVPRDGGVLVSADYSQIELRLLAAFSECEPLIKAFNSGADIHTATAAKIFGVPKEKVTAKERGSAKAVNFGIIYGISEYGLAKNLHISPVTAKKYIDSYFAEYPEVKEYMKKNVENAHKSGYAVTVLKRRRYIREINSANFNLRSFGERAAMNMPLQGSSADIIKLAMINVYRRLEKEGLKAKLILQIHDELIVDAPKEEKERVEKILKEEMEGAITLSVPLTVSVGTGENWFEAK